MKNDNPAIIAVGYNRPDSMRILLNSIKNAIYHDDESVTVIISIDKSDRSEEVINVAQEFNWTHGEKIIIPHEARMGLRNHILSCGDLSDQYGAVIILEDDLIVAKDFYQYVKQAIRFYKNDPKIAGIALYTHAWNGYAQTQFIPQKNNYDCFFGQFSITWGQCWTDNQWNKFKIWYKEHCNININSPRVPQLVNSWGSKSWGKFFVNYIVEKDLYYVVPFCSMSTNCSLAGEHNSTESNVHQVMLSESENMVFRFPLFQYGVKYDVFFERVFDKNLLIHGIQANDICFDLNNCRNETHGKKYLATERKIKAKIIGSFGLQVRPIEKNVLLNIEGDDIKLYKIEKDIILLPQKKTRKRWTYELYGNSFSMFLNNNIYNLLKKFKRMLIKK